MLTVCMLQQETQLSLGKAHLAGTIIQPNATSWLVGSKGLPHHTSEGKRCEWVAFSVDTERFDVASRNPPVRENKV
jgi:hypothetical protein